MRLGASIGLILAMMPAWLGAVATRQVPAPLGPATSAPAQDPVAPGDAAAAPKADRDLSTRYQFSESYQPGEPGSIPVYDVAYRETAEVTVEGQSGSRQIVASGRYSELPTDLRGIDGTTIGAVIRRYTAADVEPNPYQQEGTPALLGNLDLLIRKPGLSDSEVVVLSGDRNLRTHEFDFLRQTPYVPFLEQMMPGQALRLGDGWAVAGPVLDILLGEHVVDGALEAELVEIRPRKAEASDAPNEEAVVELAGELTTVRGPTGVRARLVFPFRAETPAPAPAPAGNAAAPVQDPLVAARGGLARLRVVHVTQVPAQEGVPAAEFRRDLQVERRWPSAAALVAPEPLPTATPENSWLRYVDPKGRYAFRYPQNLAIRRMQRGDAEDVIDLTGIGEASGEVLNIRVKHGVPMRPGDEFAKQLEDYRQKGIEVDAKEARVLPEADWPGREAHYLEALFTPDSQAAGARVHLDAYVINFTQPGSLLAYAFTNGSQAKKFQETAESVLKTFEINPATR